MAQILKELEAPAGAPTAASQPKPQPIALEIPVTVNGARTVEGSDKRVPFSENTQTVLVLPHGTVIRTSTPLASGQLVFLTNEKTKKEVVCQVVKSKSTGSSGSYVELQFTEPSPGFWGLQIPGGSATPAPRLVPPAQPAAPKPTAPVAAIPPAPPKPVAPAVPAPSSISALPEKPMAPAPTPAVMLPAPVAAKPESVLPATIAPPIPVVPPAPVAAALVMATPVEPVKPVLPADLVPPAPAVTDSPVAPPPNATSVDSSAAKHPSLLPPVPPLRDYTKDIQALFGTPHAPARPATPESHPAPPSKDVTTEDLKQQAAKLQSQLSSMIFTEVPSQPSVAPKAAEPAAPVAEVAKKVPSITKEEPKASTLVESTTVSTEPKAVPPALKPASVTLADEEVKIPSWLAPISQNSDASASAESSDFGIASADHSVSLNSEESYDALVGDSQRRPQTAVFGGQLLGEAAAPAEEVAGGSSKKGLIFGLIAAALLIAGGGGWYFTQNHASSAATAITHSTTALPSESSAPSVAAPTVASTPSKGNSSAVVPAEPSRNSVPAPSPAAPTPQPKNSKPGQKTPEAVEEPAKPSLGDVHLAAPVVNHSEDAKLENDGFQSVATTSVPAGTDPFSAGHQSNPTAPLPVGGDVKPAELIKSVPPEYPAIAKSQHVAGKVTLDALIDTSGNVASVKVVSGPTLLHRAASEAVKQWKYKPAVLDGEPTSSHLAVTVEFRAQ
jgi:TonB family protein